MELGFPINKINAKIKLNIIFLTLHSVTTYQLPYKLTYGCLIRSCCNKSIISNLEYRQKTFFFFKDVFII